ncbi:transporter substrate-binding domain-containing protein [Neiella marina]|uniref:Transporter substrate-binding domain-containing protein n=1 Tax=Neiella holothuriorum TaxID=2870530 RepID=A0ABS7EBN6_9GAMM|nr:transporter substrate-binding domain-containing protein [Neiella holothuriorum]MBW8189744.1 transporter substrate-binding domain-containing protein [Neiella holothuriorum]
MTSSQAEPIEQIVWATPAWPDYTDRDGSGLYHEILDRIFDPLGIPLIRQYMPWKRALASVEAGSADMTGAVVYSSECLLSSYPVIKDIESVLFKPHKIEPWLGVDSLRDKSGVWVRGYTIPKAFTGILHGRGVETRKQAVLIMARDHGADYYLDNEPQMRQTIASMTIAPDLAQHYQIERLYTVDSYWRFHRSERGENIRRLFDQGIQRLYCSGELDALYQKWQLSDSIPEYQIDCATDNTAH